MCQHANMLVDEKTDRRQATCVKSMKSQKLPFSGETWSPSVGGAAGNTETHTQSKNQLDV